MTEITDVEPREEETLLEQDDDAVAADAKAQSNSDEEVEDHDDDADEAPTRSSHRPSSRRRQIVFLALFLLSLWLAYAIRVHLAKKQKPQIIYASRYVLHYTVYRAISGWEWETCAHPLGHP